MSLFPSDLLEGQTKQCVFMNRSITLDEYGSYVEAWTEGAPFDAVITENNSVEATVAGIQNKTTFYGVLVENDVPLAYMTVFKRVKDGKTFRIRNGDAMNAPSISSLNMKVLQAEEYAL